MEKVTRSLLIVATVASGLFVNAAEIVEESKKTGPPTIKQPAIQFRQILELTTAQIADDAAVNGISQSETNKVQFLAASGMEVFGKVEGTPIGIRGGLGSVVGLGAFGFKRGGSGDRSYMLRVGLEGLTALHRGEYFHGFVYPGAAPKGRATLMFFLSPALAYKDIIESGQTVDFAIAKNRVSLGMSPQDTSHIPIVPGPSAAMTDAHRDNFKTLSGIEYRNAPILSVEADGILIQTTVGNVTLKFSDLPDEMRAKYQGKAPR